MSDALLAQLLPPKSLSKHFGTSIFLPPGNEGESRPSPAFPNVVYRSTTQNDAFATFFDLDIIGDKNGTALSCHRTKSYIEKFSYLSLKGSDPLDVGGFGIGTQCKVDFQCKSGLCSNNTC